MKKVFFKEVLERIVPCRDERARVLKQVNVFLSALNSELKRCNLKAIAVLGGSYAKDTWLSGDYDVDVFVKFDIKHNVDNLSDLLERALKKWSHERIHGSRDYFWIRDGVKYELVPVLDINKASDAENVTDFSPLHVRWVNKNGSKLKDDIRLAKKFCKSAHCYGAESYIRGFSGHVLDILTIYYKGFLPLLKAATKWKPKVVLDYNNVFKGKALLCLNSSKIEGPLVLIDPVQPDRNASAALTIENFDKFIKAAKLFLKKPSLGFFVEKQIDFDVLKKKGNLVKLDVVTLDDKEDVAGTKFVRAFEFVQSKLKDFVVLDSGWIWDKKEHGIWWFVLKNKLLPKEFLWQGPPVNIELAVKDFKKKYKSCFIKNKRLWTKIVRVNRSPEQALSEILKDEFVVSRVKGVR